MAASNHSAAAGAKAELKLQQATRRRQEADQANRDQAHARESELNKTARLRALRLAKEQTEREAAAAAPMKRTARKKTV